MPKPPFTDAEFEVVSGPLPALSAVDPVSYARMNPPKPYKAVLVLRWLFVGLLVTVAGFTALMGALGADIDTRDSVAYHQPQPVKLR